MKAELKLIKVVILLSSSFFLASASFSNEKILNCKFREQTSYACLVSGLENHGESAIIAINVIGNHVKNKSNLDVTVLTIKGQNLTFIPKKIENFFPGLQRFEVRNSSLVCVSRDNFKGFKKLETLILENNFIESLSPDVFEDLTSLKNLRLSGNKLSELEHKIFVNNIELEILTLDNNKIVSLHENQFASLLKLRQIYLNNNEVVELREQTFAKNSKLTTIDVSNNRLSIVGPELLKNLAELKKFDFQNNECIKKSYKTIDELSQIFYNNCLPPYFKNYDEKIQKLLADANALNETLKACEENSQTLTGEKEELEAEKDNCISDKTTCDEKLKESESEKGAKENELEETSEKLNKTSESLDVSSKNLSECRLSEKKCLESNNFINETVAAALKKSTFCIKQLDALRDLTKLNNATIDDLEAELGTKSLEIVKLQNRVNELRADKKKMQMQIDELESQLKTRSIGLSSESNGNTLSSSTNPSVQKDPEALNANTKRDSCEHHKNELTETKSKLIATEKRLKSALSQLPACNSFLIACSFGKSSKPDGYACKAKHISACQPAMQLASVEGTHERFKSNMNVDILEVKDSIFHFPDDIFKQLPNLRVIEVSNSGLSTLQPKLKSTKLRELIIFDNKFSEIPERIFEGVENLEALFLDSNEIQRLYSGSLAGLARLTQLNLNNNLISDLPDGIFEGLSNLRGLSLNNNRLTFLSGELFSHNQNLEVVQFNDNTDLKSIGQNLLSFSKSLRIAQFRGTCIELSLSSGIEEIKRYLQINCKHNNV